MCGVGGDDLKALMKAGSKGSVERRRLGRRHLPRRSPRIKGLEGCFNAGDVVLVGYAAASCHGCGVRMFETGEGLDSLMPPV